MLRKSSEGDQEGMLSGPITLIVTAVSIGTAASLKPTAEQVIKDTYTSQKTPIHKKTRQRQGTPAAANMREGLANIHIEIVLAYDESGLFV